MKSPGHRAAGGSCQTCHSPLDVLNAQPFSGICPLCHGRLSRLWVSPLLVWGRTAQTQHTRQRVAKGPSSTASLCHQSLTKVPHLQRAQEGWRRRATTVAPAMTKSAARGCATAARSSSGRAASCARPADTARSAEVPRLGRAGAPRLQDRGSAGLTPCSPRLIRPQRQSSPRLLSTAESPSLEKVFHRTVSWGMQKL